MRLQPSVKTVAFKTNAILPERILCATWFDRFCVSVATFFLGSEPTINATLEVHAVIKDLKVELTRITACDGEIDIEPIQIQTAIQKRLKEIAIDASYEV
jgi:hypothetical protein